MNKKMNKKIKVIDLIDKKYHNLELPKHIRINKLEYFYMVKLADKLNESNR